MAHLVDYHGLYVPRDSRHLKKSPAYAAKFKYVGSTIPVQLLVPTTPGPEPPTSIVVVWRSSNRANSLNLKALHTPEGLKESSDGSVERLKQAMDWTVDISTRGVYYEHIKSNLFFARTEERIQELNKQFKYRLDWQETRFYPALALKLEKMIRDGGDRPALLVHWDNLTTNWDLFVEFVSNLPDFMFYLHSRKRAYRIERDGQARQQLLPRSMYPGFSLICANTSELKKGPLPEVDGDDPDLTTDRGRWQLVRIVMRDTGAWKTGTRNTRGTGRLADADLKPKRKKRQ